jgi:inhibitor of cysteine peptidase
MGFEKPKINFTSKNSGSIRFVYYAIFTIAFVFVTYLAVLTVVFQTSAVVSCGKVDFDCSVCKVLKFWEKDNTTVSTGNGVRGQLENQSQIKKFANYDELKQFLDENKSSNNGYYGNDMPMMTREMAIDDLAFKSDANFGLAEETTGFGGGSDDFSTTNIQVQGVDEADIIKTDGKYIYAVSNNNLFIVEAYPASESKILSKIEFKVRPQNIFIKGNKLVVYGNDNLIRQKDFYDNFRRKENYSFLKIFDISDRVNPRQVRDLDFEGNLVNTRMIGDYVYFITSTRAHYYDLEMPVPRIIEDGIIINEGKEMDVYYIDIPYSSYNFTHVAAINIEDENEDINSEAYLLGYSQNLYVSQDNIYITYTKQVSEYQLMMEVFKEFLFPKLPQKDQDIINEIEASSNYILNPEEKMRKIEEILERFINSLPKDDQDELEREAEERLIQKYKEVAKELEKTIIHKIAINGSELEYKTVGEVTGHVLNQFSMDERGGYFRIATTKNRTWSRFNEEEIDSYSNLYVLDENLRVIGSVEGLAKEERIYSVRFMQDRAYMVTFKQTDPLFVIDLKNPRDPKVLGELKIPGFSNYLHPYDNNTLIGIGKDTYENEWGGVRTGGLKLSLFDVSDVSQPKEVDNYVIGESGSDSYALRDHKAFLFSKDKNLLVMPASLREDSISGRSNYFRGALVFTVNNKGFELKGKISHSAHEDLENNEDRYYANYEESVKRGLYIDDTLYTFSDRYLKMNKLDNLDLVKNLELKKEKTNDFQVIN